ncbi:MAG: hypothetical protein RIM99_02425 [Cyclobacteriaceae bacterium]
MKKEEIDQLIEKALTDEEAEFYHKLDEQNLFEKFGGLLQGKMKWITLMTFIVQFVQFGFAIYFGYRFFNTTDIGEMIQFGAGASLLMMAVGMLKLFHWMEMNKNDTIREIKRLELQVSLLAGKVAKGKNGEG